MSWLGAKASTVFQGMNPGKKDDRSESYYMVGGSQITLRSGGIWLGPSGPLFLEDEWVTEVVSQVTEQF